MQSRNLQKNPNAGKRHLQPWDDRRSTNYAHSNLRRIPGTSSKVTVWVDRSIKGTAPKGKTPITAN